MAKIQKKKTTNLSPILLPQGGAFFCSFFEIQKDNIPGCQDIPENQDPGHDGKHHYRRTDRQCNSALSETGKGEVLIKGNR